MKETFISEKEQLVKTIRKQLKKQNKDGKQQYDLMYIGEHIGEFVLKYENKVNNYFDKFLNSFTEQELQLVDTFSGSKDNLRETLLSYRRFANGKYTEKEIAECGY
jgi:hypothetical protein